MSNSAAFILIISMIHAYAFALFLFSKKHVAKSILGIYMINIALEYFLLANLQKFNVIEFKYLFYILTPSITLNTIPLIYLYVRYMTSEKYLITWKSALHLLPSFLFLILILLTSTALSSEAKNDLLQGNLERSKETLLFIGVFALSLIVLFIQIIGYSIHVFILLYKHGSNVENIYSSKDEVSLKWLKIFVIIYFLYSIFEISNLMFFNETLNQTIYYSIISLHVFFVGFMGLRQKDIYNKEAINNENKTNSINSDGEKDEESKKSSFISEELKDEIKQRLEILMKEKKVYLNEELSLYDVSQELEINKNYLSHTINSCYGTNFYNYINSFRINEAKKMLLDPSYDNLSIEGIAKSVGFKSRGVFYPVFKKITGDTPLEFKKRKIETSN